MSKRKLIPPHLQQHLSVIINYNTFEQQLIQQLAKSTHPRDLPALVPLIQKHS